MLKWCFIITHFQFYDCLPRSLPILSWRPSSLRWETSLPPNWRARCMRDRGIGCWYVTSFWFTNMEPAKFIVYYFILQQSIICGSELYYTAVAVAQKHFWKNLDVLQWLLFHFWPDIRCSVRVGSEPDSGAVWSSSAELWSRSPSTGNHHPHRHGPDHLFQRTCDQQNKR